MRYGAIELAAIIISGCRSNNYAGFEEKRQKGKKYRFSQCWVLYRIFCSSGILPRSESETPRFRSTSVLVTESVKSLAAVYLHTCTDTAHIIMHTESMTHTHACTGAHAHTHTHTHTCTHTQTHTHAHTRTHSHTTHSETSDKHWHTPARTHSPAD